MFSCEFCEISKNTFFHRTPSFIEHLWWLLLTLKSWSLTHGDQWNNSFYFTKRRGATVSANICGEHYRENPLVKVGLEVPCQTTVCMPGSFVNHRLLRHYVTLLRNLYIEPKYEEVMGTLLSVKNKPLREAEPPQPQGKKE